MFRFCLLPVGRAIRSTIKTGIVAARSWRGGKIKGLRFGIVVVRSPVHENRSTTKRVETVWVSCLDRGSNPRSSTFARQSSKSDGGLF